MNGFWFAAMVAFLVLAGVAAQLGWDLPPMSQVKRALRLSRPPSDQPPSGQPKSAAVAERS